MSFNTATRHGPRTAGQELLIMVDSDEQRDFQRMTIDCELAYCRVDGGEERVGHAKNLSSTGILFTCNESFEPGTRLQIRISPGVALTPPLNATGEVIRVDELEDGGYEVACTIEPTPEE